MPQLTNEFGSVEQDFRLSHDSRQDSSPPSLDLYPLISGLCIGLFRYMRSSSLKPGSSLSQPVIPSVPS